MSGPGARPGAARRSRTICAGALALVAGAVLTVGGCGPDKGMAAGGDPSASAAPKGKLCRGEVAGPRGAVAKFGPRGVTYSVPVMAPDACHKALDEASTRWDGDRLVITRRIGRDPGICAQVMTRIVFEGAARDLDRPPTTLAIEVLSVGGQLVDTVTFSRAEACP